MGILRSETMKHGTMVIPTERARHFIDLIGRHANMQFEDMNSRDMRRPYKKYVQRIDEMERIVRFLFDEVGKVPGCEVTKNRNDNFLENDHEYKLDAVETELKQLYVQFMKFKENNAELQEQRNSSIEERCVTQLATTSLGAQQTSGQAQHGANEEFEFAATQPLMGEAEGRNEMMFNKIAGVIAQADQDRFARTIFRATRGNTYTHFAQIPEELKDAKTGKDIAKSVFVVYYQDNGLGGQTSAMSDKIKKLCVAFGVSQYRWPASRDEAEQRRQELGTVVADKVKALDAYERYVLSEMAVLLQLARPEGNSKLEEWRLFSAKEKAIYVTLNSFEGDITLRSNCWYPANEEASIQQLLVRQSDQQNSAMLISDRVGTKKNPPTYIRTNAFTEMSQELVNTYGAPRYGEANAALLTVVTFPFMFGIMYGDIGHGSMLLCAGLWAIWNAESLKHSVPALYKGRYMLFMMGFFGVYAGFMYNDFFSIGMDIFGSRWKQVHGPDTKMHYFEPTFDTKNEGGPGPYPFGMDPTWHGASNELIYVNSLKMKVSVLFGVFQMTVGLFLRFGNAIHEGNKTDFIFECIPMMFFMICFFGYMDFMILYKWVTPMDNPPSIINSLICMAMGGEDPAPLYAEAKMLQSVLFAITVLTVPFMLIPKPFILWRQSKNNSNGGGGAAHGGGADHENAGGKQVEEAEHFDFGEIMIHQIIETIEYVLGTVSHTASYLRLWALSLAHQQLSLVFFQKTIMAGLVMPFPANGVALFFLYGAWFGITLMVLLGMDVLECFLHTLRLHWVEFQSKFYKADGYVFEPYRHKQVLKPNADQ